MQLPQPNPIPGDRQAFLNRTERLLGIIHACVGRLATMGGLPRLTIIRSLYTMELGPAARKAQPVALVAFASTSPHPERPFAMWSDKSCHFVPARPFSLTIGCYRSLSDRRFWEAEEEALDSAGHLWRRTRKLTTDNFGTLVEVPA